MEKSARAAIAAVTLSLFCNPSPASAQAREESPAQLRVIENCPVSGDSDEAVACGRRSRSPYQLPEQREGFDPAGSIDSVSRERNRLLDVGATGIHSCSPVGPGGWTGCDIIRWKEAHEQWDGHRRGEPRLSFKVGPLKKTVVD